VALIAVFYFSDLDAFAAALRLADYRLVLAGVGTTVLWLAARGFFWRTLLGKEVGYREVFWTLNEGYLLNNLLPFRLGEIGRAFLLSRKTQLRFWEVLSTIVIERVLDLTLAVGLVMVTLPYVIGAGWARQAALAVGSLVILVFLVLYFLARYRQAALRTYVRLAQRWKILHRLGGNAVESFFSGLAVLVDGRRFLSGVAWALVNWLVGVLHYFVLLAAFVPGARLLWSSFALGVGSLGIATPSSPGAVGVFEAAIVGALSSFAVNPSVALAYAIATHLLQIIVTTLLGVYALARDGETLAGLYAQVREVKVSSPFSNLDS